MRLFPGLLLSTLLLTSTGAFAQNSPGLFIDASAHLHGALGRGQADYDGAAREALRTMDEFSIRLTVLQPPPFTSGHELVYDAETLGPIVSRHPDRLRFMAGGGSLSPMLLDSVKSGEASEDLRARFAATARKIADAGAVGFGEIALEHFGLGPEHRYEQAPPDHPLMLILSDIAAERDIPVFVHLEAIEREEPIDPKFAGHGNPDMLRPNIRAFERLLAHNPKARFVWGQLGWDHTGQGTPELMARLLAAHPNLFAALKIGPDSLEQNRPMARGLGLRPEWLDLFIKFPDRILLGSDQFHAAPGAKGRFIPRLAPLRAMLSSLPADIAAKIGAENAIRVYKLGS